MGEVSNIRREPGSDIVCVCYGFTHEQGAKARGIGWQKEVTPTLRDVVVPAILFAWKETEQDHHTLGMDGK